ncbi:hypothetical protein HYW84_02245 [Candidatus Peregrinibacteria bacterium]|nr:hypothetical protein [Candidatus Peregrinibacteria bacterium]
MKIPPPFNWLWSAWKIFGAAVGKAMSKVILTILWIAGFGLYAIILKIMRLFAKKSRAPDTYWIDVPPPQPGDLHRQF